MTHFVATCINGVESLVRGELERQGIRVTYGQDRMVGFEGDMMTLTQANLWLRTANRIYIEVEKIELVSLEMLFASVEQIDWSQWIPVGTPIVVSATSSRSVITHTPSMQSLGKKAIIRSLMGGDDYWKENEHSHPIEIFLLLVADTLHILINTSGDALHKRGYRQEAGEAPLKESLAASLVLFSSWKFRTPLYDPMCGSGTILIEAAMIARNIAPGLTREFDYLYFPWYDLPCHERGIKEAKTKIFDKTYEIYGSDNDSRVLEYAMENAHRAGVGNTIRFTESDFRKVKYPQNAHLVTNPPYGKRMGFDSRHREQGTQGSDPEYGLLHASQGQDHSKDTFYSDLEKIFADNTLTGGVITSVENFPKNETGWTKKNLMNGSEKCEFWRKLS